MSKSTNDPLSPPVDDVWRPWPISWTGVWVGALTALAVLIVIGLIAIAVGAHYIGPSSRILSWRDFGLVALAFSIGGAFFSFVAGGWVAARIAGTSRAETAMLHGGIVWLLAVPMLVVAIGLGGGSVLGPWYGGLGGTPSWAQASAPKATAPAEPKTPEQESKEAAQVARNAALGGLTALLLGLVGSALGGWLGSGEPMSYRQLTALRATRRSASSSPIQV